jgi:DNA-directed RNA polymerase omega subunit
MMPQTYTSEILKKAKVDQFNLVLMAARRAKQLQNGAMPKTPALNRSATVVALDEIEKGLYTKKDFYKTTEPENMVNENFAKKSKRYTNQYQRSNW